MTSTHHRRVLRAAPLFALLLAVGCGGGTEEPRSGVASLGSSTTTTVSDGGGGSDDAEGSFVAFSECMREHGVDLPDAGVAAGSGEEDPLAADPDFDEARGACEDLLEGVTFSDGDGPTLDPEVQDALLAYAECMRDEGIDMPDPTSGGLVGETGNLGYDPESPEFEAADEACQSLLASADVDIERTEP